MKIRIIQIGKTKEIYFKDAISEYLKRLKPYINIEITTLNECTPTKTFTVQRCVDTECEMIIKQFYEEDFFVLLDEKGKEFDSVQFSDMLKENISFGKNITFIIGGPFGFNKSLRDFIRKKGGIILSLSKLTFTHQMVRLFLIEQIYRGICIMQKKEYHIA